jgi:hypothetical protein
MAAVRFHILSLAESRLESEAKLLIEEVIIK